MEMRGFSLDVICSSPTFQGHSLCYVAWKCDVFFFLYIGIIGCYSACLANVRTKEMVASKYVAWKCDFYYVCLSFSCLQLIDRIVQTMLLGNVIFCYIGDVICLFWSNQ